MPVARVRMRGLREIPLERLLFIVVLGCSVMLLSVVMLRSEQAAGVTKAAPRTFRDGFIVAEQNEVRRTESNDSLVVVSASSDKASTDSKRSGAAGTQVQVEQQGEHTMTKIKTEDGDEITIKRAINSNKITTISAHEDGKITIENKDTKKVVASGVRGAERETEETEENVDDEGAPAAAIEKNSTEEEESRHRAGYEKMSPGKEVSSALVAENDLLGAADARRIDVDEEAATKNKKVTVVEVGRSLTKVSVHQVEEEGEDGDATDKAESTRR